MQPWGGGTKKITSRTTGAKGNKFLRVITSFNYREIATDIKQLIKIKRQQLTDNK